MTWDGRSAHPLDLGNLATAVSPHTISSQSWYRRGPVVMGVVTITLGADLGGGDIANTKVASIASALPATTVGGSPGPGGPVLACYLSNAGNIGVSATASAVASGSTISVSFTYLAA